MATERLVIDVDDGGGYEFVGNPSAQLKGWVQERDAAFHQEMRQRTRYDTNLSEGWRGMNVAGKEAPNTVQLALIDAAVRIVEADFSSRYMISPDSGSLEGVHAAACAFLASLFDKHTEGKPLADESKKSVRFNVKTEECLPGLENSK